MVGFCPRKPRRDELVAWRGRQTVATRRQVPREGNRRKQLVQAFGPEGRNHFPNAEQCAQKHQDRPKFLSIP